MKSKSVSKRNWPACRLATGGRTAALLIGLALGRGATVPIYATVIDDFEGPQLWACGGNGCDHLGPVQANGELTFAGQFPTAGDTTDNVYWPHSLLIGDLDSRVLQLRMDLVRLSGADHAMLLGTQSEEGGGYWVGRSQNLIGVVKWYGTSETWLIVEQVPVQIDNTTVVLELASARDSLRISAKILNASRALLYQTQTFVDGPGSDGERPPNLPPWAGYAPDPGAPFMNITIAWAGVSSFAEGTPPPVEVVLDNLEYDLYLAPELAIEKSVLLSWPENTAEEQIVLRAESLAGPWVPCLEPIFKRNGCMCVAVPITHSDEWVNPAGYFKLVPGHQYVNDFSNETGDGWEWNNLAENPGVVTHTFADGVLRIQDDAKETFMFSCPEPRVLYQDFSLSVDIVNWNEADQGVGLYARATMPQQGTAGTCYATVLTTKDSSLGAPGLFIWAAFPDGSMPNLAGTLAPIEAGKDYRLVFTGSGSILTAELFELPLLGTPVVAVTAGNSALTQGLAGLYIVDYRDTTESIDFTVDNLGISGTTP